MAVPPPRSPERERLASAIERRADAVAQHDRVAEALGRIDDDIFERLEPAVRRAREAFDDATAAAPALLVARTLGEPPDPDKPTVAEAEVALGDADKGLNEAREARSMLRDELRAYEHAVEEAGKAVDGAVKIVVSQDPATRAVIAGFNRAGRQCLRMSRVMRTLGIAHTGLTADDVGLSLRIGDVLVTGDHSRSSCTPDPAWTAALAGLREDADAEFPALPEPEPEPAPGDEKAAAA